MAARIRIPKSSWETGGTEKPQPRTCAVSGKRIYANEREASSTASHRMSDKQSSVPQKLRVYKCLYCDGFHLTSKDH